MTSPEYSKAPVESTPATTESDFVEFHTRVSRYSADLDLVTRALAVYPPNGSLGILERESGNSFAFAESSDGLRIRPGTATVDTLLEIQSDAWRDFRGALETTQSLLYSDRARILSGTMKSFESWGPVFEALYHGRAPYHWATVDLRNLNGDPLDPHQSFEPGDAREEMRHFLEETGYLRLRNALDGSKVSELIAVASRLRSEAVEADERSWWGTDDTGQSRLFRVHYAARTPEVQRLRESSIVAELLELSPHKMVAPDENEIHSTIVLWKQFGMVEGLADLPWHRDCQLGGHAKNCPTLVMSAHLGAAQSESGDLRFLPGSHRGSFWVDDTNARDLDGSVGVGAQQGDLTLHYSDVVHMAPSPTSKEGPFRTSLVTMYRRPAAGNHRAGDRHYFDALEAGDGHIRSI